MPSFDSFLEGQHVLHLTNGIFNGTWSYMGIETTYMKHGKGPSGIIGITTNERAVRVWSNGHHLRGAVFNELESLRDTTEKVNEVHKEEQKGRIIWKRRKNDKMENKE